MRVCFVSSVFSEERGGSGVVAQMSALGAARAGHDVVVVGTSVPTFDGYPDICARQVDSLFGLTEETKQASRGFRGIAWRLGASAIDIVSPIVRRRIQDTIREIRPDVVHFHKVRGLGLGVMAGIDAQCVYTAHDYEMLSPRGWKLPTEDDVHARVYKHLRRAEFRSVVLTAPSSFMARALEGHLNLSVRVIPNSSGFQHIPEAEPPQRLGRDVRYGYIGALTSIKGVQSLLDGFREGIGAGRRRSLTIAGDGPLKGLVQRRAAFGECEYLGTVHGDAKVDFFNSIDCLIVPSEWPETFGLVVLEALSFGRPVIVTSKGGLPELVEHRSTGFIVEESLTTEALCKAQAWIEGQDMTARLETFERSRRAASGYTLPSWSARWSGIYRGLAEND